MSTHPLPFSSGTRSPMSMIAFQWLALLLCPQEREYLWGDLEESGRLGWRACTDVFDLLIHRQSEPWRSWRPWLACLGLAWPGSLVLMGISVYFGKTLAALCLSADAPPTYTGGGEALRLLVLLTAAAWSCGYAAVLLSRRTLTVTLAATLLPAVYCLSHYKTTSLEQVSLLLFLVPASVAGLCATKGIASSRALHMLIAIGIPACWFLAPHPQLSSIVQLALLWPSWFLVWHSSRTAVRSAH